MGLGLAARADLELWLPFDASSWVGPNLISPDASSHGRAPYLNLAASNATYGVSGAVIVPDARAGGGALQLDGVNDFARVLDWSGVSGNGARTISRWVKQPASTANPNDIWVGWGDPGGAARVRWDFGLGNGTDASMRVELNAGFSQLGWAWVGDDTWHMVTVTYGASGGGPAFYLDGNYYGAAEFTAAPPNTITAGNLGIAIGAGIREVAAANGNANRFVGGLLDDVRIYSRALSTAEVRDLYLAIVPEPSSGALFALGAAAFLVRRSRKPART